MFSRIVQGIKGRAGSQGNPEFSDHDERLSRRVKYHRVIRYTVLMAYMKILYDIYIICGKLCEIGAKLVRKYTEKD